MYRIQFEKNHLKSHPNDNSNYFGSCCCSVLHRIITKIPVKWTYFSLNSPCHLLSRYIIIFAYRDTYHKSLSLYPLSFLKLDCYSSCNNPDLFTFKLYIRQDNCFWFFKKYKIQVAEITCAQWKNLPTHIV